MRIKVLGIGQPLRGDDSAGLEIVRRWRSGLSPQDGDHVLAVQEVESPGLNLLSLITDFDVVILVDAVQSGSSPGTLHELPARNLEAFLEGADSAHGWGIAETLRLGETLNMDAYPSRIHLLGIEIASVQTGAGLSPAVQDAIPQAVQKLNDMVSSLLANHHSGDSTEK